MTTDDTSPGDAGIERFAFTVNGVRHKSRDAVRDGRQILHAAGFRPATDHVLIRLTHPGSTSIGLDDEVDLAEAGREEFRAFSSDRIFRFTLDEVAYEWGHPTISEADLRAISGTEGPREIVLEQAEGDDEVLGTGATVDLGERGTERFYTENRLVTVYYRDDPVQIERGLYIGAELALKLGAPSGYVLDRVNRDGEFKEIAPTETLKVREGMRFVSHPPCGQSS